MSEGTLEKPVKSVAATADAGAGLDGRPRPEPRSRPGLALAIILTCQLMLMVDATVMNVALPRIETGLHFSPASLAWVLDAYTLTFGGLLLLGGRLGDLFGRRRLFTGGIVLFTIASLAGGFATSAGFLLAARVARASAPPPRDRARSRCSTAPSPTRRPGCARCRCSRACPRPVSRSA